MLLYCGALGRYWQAHIDGSHFDRRRSLSGRSGHAQWCGSIASVADDPNRSL